jgi:hypothetical protein
MSPLASGAPVVPSSCGMSIASDVTHEKFIHRINDPRGPVESRVLRPIIDRQSLGSVTDRQYRGERHRDRDRERHLVLSITLCVGFSVGVSFSVTDGRGSDLEPRWLGGGVADRDTDHIFE